MVLQLIKQVIEMEQITYSILLDLGHFGNFLVDAISANFDWLCMMIGVKIGLVFLRDSIN